MKAYSPVFLFLLLFSTLQYTYAEVWGSTGQRVIGVVAQNHLTPKAAVMAAPLLDWLDQSQDLANVIYDTTPKGARLGYVYHYQNFETVRKQLLDAGLRLAASLNAIFDPTG